MPGLRRHWLRSDQTAHHRAHRQPSGHLTNFRLSDGRPSQDTMATHRRARKGSIFARIFGGKELQLSRRQFQPNG